MYAPPDRVAKGDVRRLNQNSQNEPGMSAGINEIENRGGEEGVGWRELVCLYVSYNKQVNRMRRSKYRPMKRDT